MIKTICFDFGNTRLKAAIFEDDQFKTDLVIGNDDPATIEALLQTHQPQKAILSSVIHHNP
ncbi:MAG TPA: type III pantothenate kinase, partial [Ferruginibacter sp.]|nr:type III pantothenate kinase [Ferruginibacter sp.]